MYGMVALALFYAYCYCILSLSLYIVAALCIMFIVFSAISAAFTSYRVLPLQGQSEQSGLPFTLGAWLLGT